MTSQNMTFPPGTLYSYRLMGGSTPLKSAMVDTEFHNDRFSRSEVDRVDTHVGHISLILFYFFSK
jgi:hypothetical protein